MNSFAHIINQTGVFLDQQGMRWSLVGGLAVSARTEPRFTRDVDVAVAVRDDSEAESLVNDLVGRGYRLLFSLEQEQLGRLAAVRLLPPGEAEEGVIVDLLFASSGIEQELIQDAEIMEIMKHVVVPLPRVGHLLALKILARDDEHRPQDYLDIRALLSVADGEELIRTRRALELIIKRGFHRQRDLLNALDELIHT